MVLVGALAAIAITLSGGTTSRHAPTVTGKPPAVTGAGSSHSPATTVASTSTDPNVQVPADWVAYTDPQTGFHLRYPPGWQVQQQGTHTTFTDPSTGDYLLVDHQSPPAATPQGPWYDLEPTFAASHAGYERITITPTSFKGYAAAVWEYRYTSGSRRLHAIDLGMIVGSNGYALNIQTSDAQWSAFAPRLAQLEAGFAPAG